MSKYEIKWWRISFGQEEADAVKSAIDQECISQGAITNKLENEISDYLKVRHVIATSSGSASLMMALIAAGVGVGDEVLIPNRTWIATAHAAHLLGAKVVLVDVEDERPVIDADLLEAKISNKTQAIIAVHINGRSADMNRINSIARSYGITVIEDASQAFGSANRAGYLGTQSAIGCFSLSVAKIVASGQGGFSVTDIDQMGKKLKNVRTHGVEDVKDVEKWEGPGFNFRFTDIQASIARVQLFRIEKKISHCSNVYSLYVDGLSSIERLRVIPVDLTAGEVPVYNEWLCPERDALISYLASQGIECRPFYPNLNNAPYFEQEHGKFPNSRIFGQQGIYLPSGPDQPLNQVEKVINTIRLGDQKNLW